MKVDFTTILKGLDGKDLSFEDEPLTLGVAAAMALNTQGENSLRRGLLAMRVYAAGPDADVTPEDAALIRENLPKVWMPIVVAQAHELLGGEP